MIRQASYTDAHSVAILAAKMWQNHGIDGLQEEFERLLSREDAAIFLYIEDEYCVGFAQCQLRRDYVEGSCTSPVGYLEGVFVEKPYRGRGYAKQLVQACEDWARGVGCREFASDCELDNLDSFHFHLRSGFREANRIICFIKKL